MTVDKELYIKDLTFFIKNYGVDFGVNNMERLIALILLCNITKAIRKTSPDVLVLDVINKIIKEDSIPTKEFWIKTSYQCEALLTGDQVEFPDFGFKELQSKVNKIKEINENILPF